jgi:1-acyl-sn-glycerol-3-phosphate acyltransferase
MNTNKNTFNFRNTLFRRFVIILLRFFMNLFAEIEVEHPERVLGEGALMAAANHVSACDAIIMQLVIQRPLCFMSKAELFRNPLFAWFLNQIGSFSVKRGEFDRQAILNAKGVLDAGQALMMFPEGTRTFGKGMVEARTGTAYLAMRNRCPIIPVSISGAERILKNGLRRAKVQVAFGEPIQPGEKENASQLTTRMMRTIAKPLPEPLKGFYA